MITAPLIIGGREVDPPFKYPSYAWTMVLEIPPGPDQRDGDPEYQCAVVIIKENWVLTAQHCMKAFGVGGFLNFSLLAGRHNVSRPEETEQSVAIVELIVHPNITEG